MLEPLSEVNDFQMEIKDAEFWSTEVFYPKRSPMTFFFHEPFTHGKGDLIS